MKAMLLVALGGAVGSVLRFRLSDYVLAEFPGARLPYGTMTVNVLGCLVAGLLTGLSERTLLSADARLLLFTGLLGGFTTFSAFGVETLGLLRRGDLALAAANVAVSLVMGILALYLGLAMGKGGS